MMVRLSLLLLVFVNIARVFCAINTNVDDSLTIDSISADYLSYIIMNEEKDEMSLKINSTILLSEAMEIYNRGIQRLTLKAKTEECKNLIEKEFVKYMISLADESAYPFEDLMYYSQCPTAHATLMYPYKWSSTEKHQDISSVPPPRLEDDSLNPDTLSIAYVLMVHGHDNFVKRIVTALMEPQHTFVIHVDLKAESVYQALKVFVRTQRYKNVFLVENTRVAANWGGYSIVNATLSGMLVAWETGRYFDFLIDLSGVTYPIRSNRLIRETLAMKGGNKIYMQVATTPTVTGSSPDYWNHFIECDDSLHRIARLTYPRGINLYTGSQWFILPRHVVEWFLFDPLPKQFSAYAKHIMVADENYFTTLIMNSPYCSDIISNNNYVFLLFDKWEHENKTLSSGEKVFRPDPRKCTNPNPMVCGRSPTILTTEYRNLLQMSMMLFSRKFDPLLESSLAMVDEIDVWRKADDKFNSRGSRRTAIEDALLEEEDSEVMIRQRFPSPGIDYSIGLLTGETMDMCLEVHQNSAVVMMPCNSSIEAQWLSIGPCTGGAITKQNFLDGHCAIDDESANEIFCQIRAQSPSAESKNEDKVSTKLLTKKHSKVKNTCLDISGENPNTGGALIGWDCTGQWNQLFRLKSDCSISAVLPEVVGRVRGFEGRGDITLCLETKEEAHLRGLFVMTSNCYVEQTVIKRPLGQIFEIMTRKGDSQSKYLP